MTHASYQQFSCYVSRTIHGAIQTLWNPYRRNPVDTVVRNHVILAIILSRTMQAAFGTSRAIPRKPRRGNTRASIAQCIVVASCRGEINVTPAPWEWQAIGRKKKERKENKGTGKNETFPFGKELADHYNIRCVCSHPCVAALVPRIG